MTLPAELQTSINSLKAKHAALVQAVNDYRNGSVGASKQALDDKAAEINRLLEVEEKTLLGQVARKSGAMPSMVLDFAKGKCAVGDRRLERFTSLADILTFSRSTGGGRFNAQGQYEWVGPDVPRIDYDPVTGECLGLLVEGQRTNLATNSRGNGSFGSVPVWEENAAVGLDGTMSATVWQETIATNNRYELRTGEIDSIAPGSSVVLSWYEKPISVTSRVLEPRTLVGFSVVSPVVERPAGNGWTRYHVLLEALAVDEVRRIRLYNSIGITASTTGLFAVDGIQVEEGAFPSTLIPTQGTAVTRGPDFPSRILGGEYNRRGFTLYAEGVSYIPDLGGGIAYNATAPLIGIGNATTRQFGIAREDTTAAVNRISAYLRDNGLGSGGLGARSLSGENHSFPAGVFTKAALSISLSTATLASMGVIAGATSAANLFTDMQPLWIGRGPHSGHLHGHVKSIRLYPRALTESELQEITAQ